jgi:hypothetical protein
MMEGGCSSGRELLERLDDSPQRAAALTLRGAAAKPAQKPL